MTKHANPVIGRYLEEFEKQLQAVDAVERAEMVREIENHIAEATHADAELSTVLERLGPAARLADAYRVELALKTEAPKRSWARTAGFLALLATTSVPSFLIVTILGVLGPVIMFVGVVSMFVAPISFLRPELSLINVPWTSPLAEISVFWFGIVLVMFGTIVSGVLWLYVRFMRGVFQTVLRKVRSAHA